MVSIKDRLAAAEELYAKGNQDEAFDRYTDILSDPKLKSDEFFRIMHQRGSILNDRGQYDDAREVYLTAVAKAMQQGKNQKASEFWHESGVNEVAAGRLDAAISDFRRELDLSSSRYENYFFQLSTNYYEQGSVFLTLGDLDESRMYFELALAFAETDGISIAEARAHDGLGRYYEAAGTDADALMHIASALSQYNEAKDRAGAQRMRRLSKRIKDRMKPEKV